jgi:DNA-binding transcriptional MerR regulator
MATNGLKVGELAQRTGLTVRTLHHYDEIGLLKPSLRTESGHRLYTSADVARLQQVVSLRQLGFSLEEIGACLDKPGFSPLEVIRLHVARLREQIELQQALCHRLQAIKEHLESAGEVSAEVFIEAIEGMHMIESYYTQEQLESFRKRSAEAAAAGRDLAQEGTAAWNDLLAQYAAEMKNGTDPADPKAQVLEKRRRELVQLFTGGDKAIEQNLTRLWMEQSDKLCAQFGMDPHVVAYLRKVNEAANNTEGAS